MSSVIHSLAMKIVKQAMRGRKVKDVILYTDQGSVYTTKEFQSYAKQNGIITSISRKGNFHDNAIMESFFAHLKADFLLTKDSKSIQHSCTKGCARIHSLLQLCANSRKSNHLSPKNLGNRWFRCFDRCSIFRVHFSFNFITSLVFLIFQSLIPLSAFFSI